MKGTKFQKIKYEFDLKELKLTSRPCSAVKWRELGDIVGAHARLPIATCDVVVQIFQGGSFGFIWTYFAQSLYLVHVYVEIDVW